MHCILSKTVDYLLHNLSMLLSNDKHFVIIVMGDLGNGVQSH